MHTQMNESISLRARFAGLGLAAFASLAIACATPQIALAEGDVTDGVDGDAVVQTDATVDATASATEETVVTTSDADANADETVSDVQEQTDTTEGTVSDVQGDANAESADAAAGDTTATETTTTEDTESATDVEGTDEATESSEETVSEATETDASADVDDATTDETSAGTEQDSATTTDQDATEAADVQDTTDTVAADAAADSSATATTEAVAKTTAKATTSTATVRLSAASAKKVAAAATTDWSKGHWQTVTVKGKTQMRWVSQDGTSIYKSGLIDPSWGLSGNKAGIWAYAKPNGYIVLGRYATTNGKYVYLANPTTGKLFRTGWVVSKTLTNGSYQRYYIDPTLHAAVVGLGKTSQGTYYYTRPTVGYVVRGKWRDSKGNVWLADNNGKLPKTANGWLVTNKFDNGTYQRYYMQDHHAKTGFIKLKSGERAYGIKKTGYVSRGVLKTKAGWTIANSDGILKRRRWIVTDKFGTKGVYQRYYLEDNGSTATNRVVTPEKDNVSYYAYALSSGVIMRGAKKVGTWTYLADNDGKLATADKAGWVVTKKYGTSVKKRYYLEKTSYGFYAVKNGYSTKGYAHYSIPGKGYVKTNSNVSVNGTTYHADSTGKLTTLKYLNGIDIASWQAGINISKVDAAFVIVKTTQGQGANAYINPYWKSMANATLKSGKLLGLYHYADTEFGGGDPIKEADYFAKTVKDYIGKAILCLDWEGDDNDNFDTGIDVSWCKKFLDRLYKKTGVRGLLYTSKNFVNAYDWSSVSKNYGLWCAQYADMEPTTYQKDPWTDSNPFGSWGSPTIYQYSGMGKVSGYSGYLDINMFYGTKTTWKNLCATK